MESLWDSQTADKVSGRWWVFVSSLTPLRGLSNLRNRSERALRVFSTASSMTPG
jgi:hypothetical protein